jgi:hypothetical protein
MTAIATAQVPHAPYRYAKANDGTIFLLNGIDRPQAWDGLATATRNWGMDSPTGTPTLAAGAAGLPNGTYYYYVSWYNEKTGEYSGLSPISASFTATLDQVTVTKVSTTTDAQVTHWAVWRNTDGQTDTFYLVGRTAYANATFTDNVADDELETNQVMEDRTVLDGKYCYVQNYKGRMVAFGSRVETTGTATATNASGNVTGAGTYFKPSHVGQRIRFGSDTAEYTIATRTSDTAITITPVYAGSTGGGKTFRIYPVRQSDITWSAAGTNEGFAIADSVGVFPNDGDLPTGLHVIGHSLVPFKRTHAYRFSFDGGDPSPITGTGSIAQVLSSRGLIRHECCTVVDSIGYCLDSKGIYTFDGAGPATPIDAGIRRLFQPDDGIASADRVNRAYASTWHSVEEPKTNSIVWFVTCGSETKPKTALVYEIERQRWSVWKYPMAITASCLGQDSTGEVRAWVGDENGNLWALSGVRQVEGAATSGQLTGTATAGGASTLTDGGASFQTTNNGLAGVPVCIIAGTGEGQERIIQSNTGTQLTVSSAWSTQPDATSVYLIGYIESKWRYAWGSFDRNKRGDGRRYAVYYDPTTSERSFFVRVFKDYDSNPVLEWMPCSDSSDGLEIDDAALSDGWLEIHTLNTSGYGRVEIPAMQNYNSVMALEFRTKDANKPVIVSGYDMVGFVQPVPEGGRTI